MTPEQKIHIQYLLARYLDGNIAASEEQQLFQYIDEEKDNTAWQELLEEFMASEQSIIINKEEYRPILTAILSKRKARVRRMGWIKWAAAACIILVTGYVLWVTIGRRSQGAGDKTQVAKTNDVPAPNETRAVITLADGRKVYLDSVNNGTIAQENNVDVVKNENGEIIYSHKGAKAQSELVYNTLSNSRGSKVISLTLSDGTKVWLNSESSLRYPASFAPTAVSREVEITGEAYFEVKHNSQQPFKVHLPNGSVVEDIGTSFNINSYSDEDGIKTTLIEGSVRITAASAASAAVTIKPGQQAIVSNPANPLIPKILVQTNVDMEQILAWKNGKFSYSNTDLPTIMRQMARWYDVEVIYQDPINDRYTVDVPRTVPVSQLFKFIEMSGGVHFKIEGKKIIVMK